jgi:hypothetical protein
MARNKKHRGGKRMTLPLAVVAGFAVPVVTSWQAQSTIDGKMKEFLWRVTGYNANTKHWETEGLKQGALPIFAGFAAHYLASRLGINRALARAGIPFVRI